MLYTLASTQYSPTELQRYFAEINEQDALVLWGDAVLLIVKQADLLQQLHTPCYVMADDLTARHLQHHPNITHLKDKIQLITLDKLVELTEQYYPQFAL
ncbi:DsrH/TusB family sulfur relay protein [Lonepinella sp. MS14436]|uniref:DsrH/TusB family sulfur relay protein n=1 Tax=Lonepinella sp. MS14436 TaxID=3003619 RepID=UPI0036DF1C41